LQPAVPDLLRRKRAGAAAVPEPRAHLAHDCRCRPQRGAAGRGADIRRRAEYMPDFEIYLQFDSFERHALKMLRGADLRDVRMRALERLNRLGISTTLVVTLKKGLNDS